jgi:hypothetical protein
MRDRVALAGFVHHLPVTPDLVRLAFLALLVLRSVVVLSEGLKSGHHIQI